ncbi:MAG: hypothetical protein F7B11_03850 [Caldisphaeraceae archaeon]|nr:hypothetical protein [Caldisphaeraceae archaeon]
MGGMPCKCEGIDGIKLVLCLAPPAGDYEVSIDVGSNKKLIVNSEGIFLRSSAVDDFLPFLKTSQIRVSEKVLGMYRISFDKLICNVTDSLINASNHGSAYAKLKVESCKSLINNLREKYCRS